MDNNHHTKNTSTTYAISARHKSNSKSSLKYGRYTLESGDITSTIKQISTPKDLQIYAQTSKSGGSGDGGDIFRVYLVSDCLSSCPMMNMTTIKIREYLSYSGIHRKS